MQCYRIKNWEDRENADTRKYTDLIWFRTKVKLFGEGLGHTLAAPCGRGPHLYGMFKLIEQIAASGRQGQRGWLFRNGSPLDAGRIANLLRLPAEDCEEALTFFSTAPLDWIEKAEYPGDSPGNLPAKGENPDSTGRTPGDSPGNLPVNADKGDSTGRNSQQSGALEEKCAIRTNERTNDLQRRSTEEEEYVAPGIEIADYPQLLAFIAEWPGELASGATKIPKEFAEAWLAKMDGRERWPSSWKRKLISDWRTTFRTWGKTKKKAPAAGEPKKRERWQIEKELAAVLDEIRLHPKSNWPGNKPMPSKVALEWATLVKRRNELKDELKEEAK